MKLKTITNNLLTLIAIAGVILTIYAKVNPEVANQYWSDLHPNYRISILTVFFSVAGISTFPRKPLGEKKVVPIRYLKSIAIFGILIAVWYQWLSAI